MIHSGWASRNRLSLGTSQVAANESMVVTVSTPVASPARRLSNAPII